MNTDETEVMIETSPQLRRWPRELALMGAGLTAMVGAGAAVRAITGSKRTAVLAAGVSALAAAALRWQLQRWFTVQPAYDLERRIGRLEIRRYAPRVVARTRVAGDIEGALNEGFRRLAGYIFGGNRAGEKIAMTAPVVSKPDSAPKDPGRVVSFTMPPGKSLQNLPHPDDARVELAEMPARRIAVLRSRGSYRHSNLERMASDLRRLLTKAGIAGSGEPMFAGYDPPSTIPFLRRVEMWLELA